MQRSRPSSLSRWSRCRLNCSRNSLNGRFLILRRLAKLLPLNIEHDIRALNSLKSQEGIDTNRLLNLPRMLNASYSMSNGHDSQVPPLRPLRSSPTSNRSVAGKLHPSGVLTLMECCERSLREGISMPSDMTTVRVKQFCTEPRRRSARN